MNLNLRQILLSCTQSWVNWHYVRYIGLCTGIYCIYIYIFFFAIEYILHQDVIFLCFW